MYIIIAFKSRNSSIKLSNLLGRLGIPARVVNTPREVSIGCGLSVSIERKYLEQVRDIILETRPVGFAGYYEVTENNGQRKVRML